MKTAGKRILIMLFVLALVLIPALGMEAAAEMVSETTEKMYGIANSGGVVAVTFELEVEAQVKVTCSYSAGLSEVWLKEKGDASWIKPREAYSGSDNYGDTYEYDKRLYYDLEPGIYQVCVAPHMEISSTLYWVQIRVTYEAHTHNYNTTKVVPPTCSEEGYTKHICDCGDSYKEDFTDRLPHTEAYSTEVPATCQKTGKTAGTYCSVCNTTISGRETIPLSGHPYVNNVCTSCGIAAGSCGSNLKWVLETNGKLTIFGSGPMYDYGQSGAPWSKVPGGVVSVTFPEGLTSIGAYAFAGCTGLTELLIPDSVAAIGEQAFQNVTVTVHYNDKSDAWKELAARNYGGNITWGAKHSYQSRKTEATCTEQGYTTHTCVCGARYTDSYVDAGHRISNGVCDRCGNIGTCGESLTWEFHAETGTLTIRGTGNMKNYGEESYNRPPWYNLREDMTAVVVEEGITGIGTYAFEDAYVRTAVLPAGLKTIGAYAFHCTLLREVRIPDSVTSIGDWAFGETQLTEVSVPASVTKGGEAIFAGCNKLRKATVASARTFDDMFLWCSNLEEVVLTDNVKIIGAGTFCDCYGLTELVLPEGLTRIEGVKQNQPNPNATSIGPAFRNCRFAAIVIPESVTHIGEGAFESCTNLVSVAIPAGVTQMKDIFAGCTSLNAVYFQGDACLKTLYSTFEDVKANIYYPAAYAGNWETASRKNWGGNLTWIQYDPCTEHSFGQWDFALTPTCSQPGAQSRYCSECEVTQYRPLASLEHTLEIYEAVAPTCTEAGKTEGSYCTACRKTITEQTTVAKRNHSWGDWIIDGAQVYRICSNCSEREGGEAASNPFADVAVDAYYFVPVLWAVDEGITNGMDATHFAPDGTCTRAQIVTFLWRACGSPKPEYGLNPFSDIAEGQWYTDAVLWAMEKGITTGTSDNTFSPDAGCTRGQVATFLWRSQGLPASGEKNIFSDIAPGAYYYNAVLWAVENQITNGMGDGTFAPDATCTRGQIVTFLFRAMA